MAYCTKCGTELKPGAAYCGTCGAAIPKAEPAKEAPTPEPVPNDDSRDIEENKIYAVLAYLGPTVLVPIFLASKSKFARFHANQGLLVCGLYIAAAFTWGLLSLIKVEKIRLIWGIPYVYHGTPWYITLFGILLVLSVIALSVLGILNAASGKAKNLPLIGKLLVILK